MRRQEQLWVIRLPWKILPLPEELIAAGNELMTWFDTSIDWDYPAGPTPWSPAEREKFLAASNAYYSSLNAAIGTEYELVNEANA